MTEKSKAQTETWTVSDEDAGDRIDKFLSAIYDEYSRVIIQRLIREGKVSCERSGSLIDKLRTSESLSEGDRITIELPLSEENISLKSALQMYENQFSFKLLCEAGIRHLFYEESAKRGIQ